MKTKKFRNVFLSVMAIVLTIILIQDPQSTSQAKQKPHERRLSEAIEQIKQQVKDLKKSKIDRQNKLKEDLPVFEEKGSDKIDENNLFYIKRKSGYTPEELDYALEGTELKGLGEAFYNAEEKYSINSLFLMSVAKHESGNGTSYLAKEKNNLFGFNAIDQDPIGASKTFDSQAESIDYVANFLNENYLNPDGKFYNGISTEAINICYASDPKWGKKVEGHMLEVGYKLLDYETE